MRLGLDEWFLFTRPHSLRAPATRRHPPNGVWRPRSIVRGENERPARPACVGDLDHDERSPPRGGTTVHDPIEQGVTGPSAGARALRCPIAPRALNPR